MRLAEAVEHHSKTFIEAIREGDGYSPPEAHEGLNQANRTLILAMHEELGQAWLGKINLHSDEDRRRIMWQYDPAEPIYNFGASFVVPMCDAELERLIRERDQAPYEGTKKDYERVETIMARITELGGHHLVWS